MAGWEPLWMGLAGTDSLGGPVCRGEWVGISRASRKCQWLLQVSRKDRTGKKMMAASTVFFYSPVKARTDFCLSSTCPNISQYTSFTYNPGAFPIAASLLGLWPSDIAYWSLVFKGPPASLEMSATDFPRPMLWGLVLSVQFSRVRGAQRGARSPHSSVRTSVAMLFLLLVGVLTGVFGSHLVSAPPTLLHVAFLMSLVGKGLFC